MSDYEVVKEWTVNPIGKVFPFNAICRVLESHDTLRARVAELEAGHAVADDVVRDAERYRAVRDNLGFTAFTDSDNVLIGVSVSKCWGQPYYGDCALDFDDAADAMLAAQQQKAGGE